ncbi:MAG: hypothetical protein H7841_00180 [Magnetospirillum sp. WYHS-4]
MTQKATFHESLDRKDEAKMGSERSFGFVFTAIFAIIGLWPLMVGEPARLLALGAAFFFLALALAVPAALKPLNRAWFRFGMLLHKVMTPLIMGLMFFGAFLPTGLIMRALGKDLLHLKFDPKADSYWIERYPPGPAPESLRNQF